MEWGWKTNCIPVSYEGSEDNEEVKTVLADYKNNDNDYYYIVGCPESNDEVEKTFWGTNWTWDWSDPQDLTQFKYGEGDEKNYKLCTTKILTRL